MNMTEISRRYSAQRHFPTALLIIFFIVATSTANLGLNRKQTKHPSKWKDYESLDDARSADIPISNDIVPNTRLRGRRRGIDILLQEQSNPSPPSSSSHNLAPRFRITHHIPDPYFEDFNLTDIHFIYNTYEPITPPPFRSTIYPIYAKNFWSKFLDQVTDNPTLLTEMRALTLVYGRLSMYLYLVNEDTIPVKTVKGILNVVLNFVYGGLQAFFSLIVYVGPVAIAVALFVNPPPDGRAAALTG